MKKGLAQLDLIPFFNYFRVPENDKSDSLINAYFIHLVNFEV